MKKILLLIIISLIMITIPVDASTWTSNSSAINGIYAGDNENFPAVFNDGTLKLVMGKEFGGYTGWSGDSTTWTSDSSIVNGLSQFGGGDNTPTIWNSSGTWKMIVGEFEGTYQGHDLIDSTWVINNSIINGLTTHPGSRVYPDVFYHNNNLKIISKYDGNIDSHYWNGTSWIIDSSISNGASSTSGGIDVYSNGDDLYMLLGEYNNWKGFKWNETNVIWNIDSEVEDGLVNIATFMAIEVYRDGNALKLIGAYYQGFNGYTGYSTPYIAPTSVPSTISIEVRSTIPSTFINDADSTGGFTDKYGYITLTPTIASSYPLDVQADLENGIKLTIVSADSIPSMPITFVGLDASNEYKLYLDGTLISTFDANSPYYYYDIITHSTLSTIEFVKVTGGGGTDEGDDETEEEEEDKDTGIIIIDELLIESDIEEELIVLFLEDPIRTVTTFLSTPTNWLILLGAYIGVYLGTLLTSNVNYPTILLYGTITILVILIIAAFGLNLLFLNILFSSTSFLLAFITYMVYGALFNYLISLSES